MLVLAAVGGGALGGWYVFSARGVIRPDLLLHTVKKEKLQVTIVERGNLESAENNEIVCRVKARAQGSTVASTIRWVIDDGSYVTKGEKLIEFDDSGLQDQLITQQIAVEKARGDWVAAEEAYKIQLIQNATDIASAKRLIEVNKLLLAEYKEGTYQQQKTDWVGKITMAQSDLAMWEERAAWSDRMSRPGRGYVTAAQAEADAARRLSASITLKGFEEQLRVLDLYTKERQITDLQGKIDDSIGALDRTEKQAKSKEVQADVLRKTMQLTHEKVLAQYHDTENEIKKCVIYSPQSGIVVYYAEERNRYGQGKQAFIAQGETVQEGQKLMRIPNLAKMLVNTRVHEAMVSRVKGDKMRKTGFSSVVHNTQLISPDLLSGLLAYTSFGDVRDTFSTNYRNAEQKVAVHGQPAKVRVNAFADHPLSGHVKSIATVPSQQDFFASDVKVYQTMIAIDESHEGLKPGMDSEVTIYVDTHEEPVLAIPLQCVLGSVNMGEKRNCYVITPEGPKQRVVTLGLSNETMVEVQAGLEEGDQVVLNPLVLLSEKERREYGNQPSRKAKQGPGKEGKDRPRSGQGPAGGPPNEGQMPLGGGPNKGDGKGGRPKGKRPQGAWPKQEG